MPYVTSVAGGVITASWANANIRDQVVTPWASAATRTGGVSVPVEGMVSWLSDVKELDVYSGAAYKFIAEPNLYVSKTLDESVTSSTALQNDDVLLLAVKANTVVEISAVVKYRAITGGEFLSLIHI